MRFHSFLCLHRWHDLRLRQENLAAATTSSGSSTAGSETKTSPEQTAITDSVSSTWGPFRTPWRRIMRRLPVSGSEIAEDVGDATDTAAKAGANITAASVTTDSMAD